MIRRIAKSCEKLSFESKTYFQVNHEFDELLENTFSTFTAHSTCLQYQFSYLRFQLVPYFLLLLLT